MFSRKWFLASLLLLMIAVVPTYAWHTESSCPYTDGEYYRPNINFRLENNQFLLVDTTTETVLHVLDDNMLSALPDGDLLYGYNYGWSRNCRYVFAINHWKPTETWAGRNTGIYDSITGQRVAFFPGREIAFEVRYSPDYRTMYIKVNDGSHMLGNGWSQAVFLAPYTYLETAGGITIRQTYQMRWDMERREFLVVFRGTPRSVHIFDMNTGALKTVVSVPDECTDEVVFQTQVDNNYLLVYTNRSGVPNNCVTVYNRNTGATVSVDADTQTIYEADQLALSPDGRYLVLGMLALRVWDLQALAPNLVDRDPLYRHEGPFSTIGAVHFIDGDTVETTSADGVQRWNIITGALEQ